MGSKKVSAPPPRDYKQEMLDSMAGQEAIQPRLLELERQYQPQYQQLQQEMMDRQMQYQMDSYQKSIPQSAAISSQYATAMAPVYGQMGEQAMGAYRQGLGTEANSLYDTMMRGANEGLAAGRGLTPEMERESQQAARYAYSARGLTNSNQGIAAEVLGGYQMGQQREDRSRQYAGAMYGQAQNTFAGAMGTYGNQMIQQSAAYSPANLYGSAYNMSQGLGAQIFQPESQYNSALIGANRQEAMSVKLANQQASNSFTNGIIGGVATIGGAMITGGASIAAASAYGAAAKCWVAREVYGKENPKWLLFREWLETSAPKWFHQLYIEEGEQFAEYIKDKPFLKAVIKLGMDTVIKLNYNSNHIAI